MYSCIVWLTVIGHNCGSIYVSFFAGHVRQTSFPLTMLEWIERVPLWKLAVNPLAFLCVHSGGIVYRNQFLL